MGRNTFSLYICQMLRTRTNIRPQHEGGVLEANVKSPTLPHRIRASWGWGDQLDNIEHPTLVLFSLMVCEGFPVPFDDIAFV